MLHPQPPSVVASVARPGHLTGRPARVVDPRVDPEERAYVECQAADEREVFGIVRLAVLATVLLTVVAIAAAVWLW